MATPFFFAYRIQNISSVWVWLLLGVLRGAAGLCSCCCWCFCRRGLRVHGDGGRRGQQDHRLRQLEAGESCLHHGCLFVASQLPPPRRRSDLWSSERAARSSLEPPSPSGQSEASIIRRLQLPLHPAPPPPSSGGEIC